MEKDLTANEMEFRDNAAIAALSATIIATKGFGSDLLDVSHGTRGGMLETDAAFQFADSMLKKRREIDGV
jgi:hypothetical protein